MFHEKLCIIPIYYNYVTINKNMYIISIFTPLKFNVILQFRNPFRKNSIILRPTNPTFHETKQEKIIRKYN